jgi:DNA-binding NarL/FixJ family response regulator
MAAQSKIRVLLVDDHLMFRETMRSLLSRYSDLEVVGEASDGQEAVESVGQLQPAVVLMDINLRKMDGITAARLITSQYPHVAILGLTFDTRDYFVYAMEKAGALEVLTKGQSGDEVYGAIKRSVASMSDG